MALNEPGAIDGIPIALEVRIFRLHEFAVEPYRHAGPDIFGQQGFQFAAALLEVVKVLAPAPLPARLVLVLNQRQFTTLNTLEEIDRDNVSLRTVENPVVPVVGADRFVRGFREEVERGAENVGEIDRFQRRHEGSPKTRRPGAALIVPCSVRHQP